MKLYLKKLIDEFLAHMQTLGEISEPLEFDISQPDAGFGDYATNAAMKLAKALGKNPNQLALRLAGQLQARANPKFIAEVAAVGGFVNFRVAESELLKNLDRIFQPNPVYGTSQAGSGKTVILEYFQLNVAKPPHVGHIRSAILGDSLKRVLKSQGYKVLADTHVGDWGTQFGIVIAAYKKYGNRAVVDKDPLNELEKLYVQYNAEMENDPQLREIGKREFAKLEKGDSENRKLWEWFVEVSMQKLFEMSRLLEMENFELHYGESFYEDKMAGIVDEALQRGVAQTGPEGEIFADLEEFGLDQAILKKSDGATTYLLRDLAKLKYVNVRHPHFWNLYIVDVRQSHHFRQVFKIAELLGWPGVNSSRHLDFGFLTLPEGAMSTRKGNTIHLEKVVEEASARALKVIEEKNPALANKALTAKKVGLAAVKYFVLAHNRKSDIVFDWDKALNFEGNTGPYLQYTHTRIYGILRKSNHKSQITNCQTNLKSEISRLLTSEHSNGGQVNLKSEELSVLRKLYRYPEAVESVLAEFMPNLLCNYLFELAQAFNSFYESTPVLQETDLAKKNLRLAIISATAQVLKNGLGLLGVEALEEM